MLVSAQFGLAGLCLVPVGPQLPALDRPALGLTLVGAAGAVGVLALLALGRSTRIHPLPGKDSTLRTHGIYGWVRHPMYTAVLLACLGLALTTGRLLAAAAVLCLAVVLLAKARFEDRMLAERYGRQFADYASRVPAVVPAPWRSRRR